MVSKLFLSFLLLVGAILFDPFCVHAQTKAGAYSNLARDVLVLINEHRAHLRLKPLVMNEIIINIAMKHSRNMATGEVEFGHDGFDERVEELRRKIKHTNSWAENVAYGAKTAKQVVKMWLDSPGHRENIEGNYNQTGIAIAKGTDGYLYFTQIFCKTKI